MWPDSPAELKVSRGRQRRDDRDGDRARQGRRPEEAEGGRGGGRRSASGVWWRRRAWRPTEERPEKRAAEGGAEQVPEDRTASGAAERSSLTASILRRAGP